MSKWGNIIDKVKAQAAAAGSQAQTMIQVGGAAGGREYWQAFVFHVRLAAPLS